MAKTKTQDNEPQEEVLTTEQQAQKLLATGQYKELWSNPAGHFFTAPERGEPTLEPGELLTHHKPLSNEQS
jgi:hypothetical protein